MIFLKIARFGGPDLFLHMLCGSVSITQAFKVCSMHGLQYLCAEKHSNLFCCNENSVRLPVVEE